MDEHTKPKWLVRDGRLSPVIGAVIIALITFIVYSPVVKAGYIWDDDTALTENPLIRSLSGLRDIWFSTKPYDYFPLTFTSFWLEWRLWGANPTGYHIVNVLLHTLGAILFWRVLLRLKIPGAWLAAMVFAVHPVCVASVGWVAERKNTLSLVFYLLSTLWYLRFDSASRATPRASRARKWYWFSLFAFLLALLSKTSVVTLPFVLWLCVWWRRRQEVGTERFTKGAAASSQPQRIFDFRMLLRLTPFFAAAVILGLATVWFQTHRAMSGNLYHRDGLGVRLLGGTWAVWFYLGKALLPLRLTMIYPRWEVNPTWVWGYFPALAWWGALAICWWFRRQWGGAVLFGLGCFFVTLLPVLGFFDMSIFVYARAADHLQYLALLGAIALVIGIVSFRFQAFKLPFRLGAGVVVLTLSVLSWNRANVFLGQETLWRDTLDKNPRAWAAYNNYGMAISEKNPTEEFNCYMTALSLNPNYADAHNNLAVVLYQRGRIDEAIDHFRTSLRLNPGNASAQNNLGGALSNQGKLDEAIRHLKQAILIKPTYTEAYVNLGKALMRAGRMTEAAKCFDTALRLSPNNPEAYNNLGNLAHAEGRLGDAETYYRTVLRFRPNSIETHHNLGLTLAALGRATEALAEFETVLKLKPNFAPAQYQIAELLRKEGRRTEAAEFYAAAARSLPDSAEAQHSLGTILMEENKAGEAMPHLREAVRLKPNWVEALNSLAWALATQPDSQFRDGAEAVRLATQACQLTGRTNVNALDTLAAAHAEAGQYVEASTTAGKALKLARSAGNANLAEQIEARLRFYKAGQPFRGSREAGF